MQVLGAVGCDSGETRLTPFGHRKLWKVTQRPD